MNKTDNFAIKEKLGVILALLAAQQFFGARNVRRTVLRAKAVHCADICQNLGHSVTFLFRDRLSVSVENILLWNTQDQLSQTVSNEHRLSRDPEGFMD